MKQIIIKTLRILTNKEKQKFFSFIVLNVIISVIDIITLALLVLIINFYTQGKVPLNKLHLPDWFLDKKSIAPLCIFMAFFIVKNIAAFVINQLQFRYVYNVASRISESNLLKFLDGKFGEHIEVDSSVYIRKITQQPIEFGHYIMAGLQLIFTEIILASLSLIAILIYNAKLFFLLSALMLPPVILLSYYTKMKLKHARANANTCFEKTQQHLMEAIHGYIESNIYDKNITFTNRYSVYQQILNKYRSDIQSVQGNSSRIIEIFAIMGIFLLIIINTYLSNSTTMEIVNISAFMAAAYKIIPGIIKISNAKGQIKTYEHVIHEFETESKNQNVIKNTTPLQAITFKDVFFIRNERTILSNINLSVCKGDMIALTGDSGKGKTTLINVLLGFLDADKGEIVINGNPIDCNARRQFWGHIAYVKQQPFIIHDTILNNITLCETEYDEHKLSSAISSAGLEELINKYPEGLKKVITENGKNISGGQRQRICLARALYKNADLTILDEPFNELDNASSEIILRLMKKSTESGKMIILITHNKKHLAFCNKVYSID